MKIKHCIFIIFFVLLVYTYTYSCSSGDTNSTTPESLFKGFAAAIKSSDEAKAETFCTKEFWNEKRDSGKRIFKQATRKKFEMRKNNVQISSEGKKAVVTVDITQNGKVVDQVYFYAIDVKGKWLFDGMDENKNHTGHYLEGRLPARFYLSDYSGNSELEELGTKLIQTAAPLQDAAADPVKQESLLKGLLIGDPGKIHSELRLLLKVSNMKLKVVATHMVDSIRRGAIVINDETGKEKVFIYVAREDDGWMLINCYTGWLSGEAILR